MSLDSVSLYHRQRQYREALGLAHPSLTVEFVADGGLCAPPGGVYATYAFTIRKIAEAYDIPLELLGGLPSGS